MGFGLDVWIYCIYTLSSYLQLIIALSLIYTLYSSSLHTHTSVLSLHYSYPGNGFQHNNYNTTCKVFSSQADFQISNKLAAISPQSSSTVISRDSLNYYSIVIAQQYFECCLLIRFRGTCLSSRCLAMNVYSGTEIPAFRRQVTIHNTYTYLL
jgi:hypothetical protein